MDAIVFRAEAALRDHPHPALRLFELVELIAADVDRGLTVERLRTLLEAHPDRFRILEPDALRWCLETPEDPPSAGRAWVIATGDDGPPSGPATTLRLRESVRWLGREIDDRCGLEVNRWHAIALSEREVRQTITPRAA